MTKPNYPTDPVDFGISRAQRYLADRGIVAKRGRLSIPVDDLPAIIGAAFAAGVEHGCQLAAQEDDE